MTNVVLAARLDPAWNRAEVDLASATETDLRYRSLLGPNSELATLTLAHNGAGSRS